MSATTIPPLVSRAQVERNIRARAVKRHTRKGGGGLGEQLAGLSGGIVRSVPLFNVPVEAGEELAESITGQTKPKESFLHPGEESAKATGAVVHAIPVAGAASELGEQAGKAIGPGGAISGVEALGDLAVKLNEVKTWARVAKVIGGALIIMFALYLLVKAISPGAAGVAKQGASFGAAKGVAKLRKR